MKKIIIILIIFLLCGCSDYSELNKLAIVSSLSIDKKNNNYLVTIEVLNTKKNAKNLTYSGTGKTINLAINNIQNISPKKIYPGHLSRIIVSKEVMDDNFINTLDMFFRINNIKDEFNLFLCKDSKAYEVLKKLPFNDGLIENSYYETSSTTNTTLDSFYSKYLKKGIDPVISVVKLDNDKVKIDNIAITRNGAFDRYLNRDETIGYNFITNNTHNLIIPIKTSSIKIINSKTNTKIKRKKDSYIININIKSDIQINDNNSNIKEKELIKLTKKEINKYIKKVTNIDTKSKFLGFERMIFLDYPNEKNYNYKIKTNITFRTIRKGEINEFKNKK